MSHIFLSYCRADQATARRFAEALQRAGFTVWWDQSLTAGEAYDKVTEKALEEAAAVVVLWSRHSVDSRWVRAEATQANARGVLIPAMIESCKRPIMFELTHTAELSGWSGADGDRPWQDFVAGLRRFVGTQAPVASSPTVVRAGRPARMIIACAMAALFIGGIGLWLFNRREMVPAASVTLAVLPFANLSTAEDNDQEYFSDGLTEELMDQLAQIKGLRVTARTSSFAFKGRNEDVRVIGRQLAVANLLEGSVRRDGSRLKITAKLVHSADGGQLWSKTYDRELSDVFATQEDVAKDVARALSVKLDVGSLPRVQGGTTNVEAYDKYLLGRDLYRQGGAVLFREAAVRLREAVALDPQFARAWLLLSFALSEAQTGLPESEAATWARESVAATAQVLELAPDAPWSKSQRAFRLMASRKWLEAEAALSGAAAPGADFEVNSARFAFLGTVGRIREQAQGLEQASQLDPLSLTLSGDLQASLDAAGLTAKAQVEYERSLELNGARQRAHIFALMRTLARSDETPAEVRERFRVLIRDEVFRMPLTHSLAAVFEDPVRSAEAIRLAVDDPENQDRVRIAVVAMYADRFGQKDAALKALRRSALELKDGSPAALWLPFVSGLRSDPQFKDLVRETGLADYFRLSNKWSDHCAPVGASDFECH